MHSNSGFRIESNLKELAHGRGLKYGCAVGIEPEEDRFLASAIAQHCNIIVPEYQMKWATVRPSPTSFYFEASDRIFNFARDSGISVRGHSLVWHEDIPNWFYSTVNQDNALATLTNHIATVVSHYAGQIHSWDVVNEVINASDGNPKKLRNSPWLTLLGEDYIKIAFETAHQADPQAILTLNEYGIDYTFDQTKQTAVLRLLESLLATNTPIHALGIQAHLNADAADEFSPTQMRNFLGEVAQLGLKIMVTEMDIVDQSLPLDIQVRDQAIADFYQKYLEVVLSEPLTIAVLTWGLSDRYTWLSNYAPRTDKAAVRPLPLDLNMNRKPTYYAIANCLSLTP